MSNRVHTLLAKARRELSAHGVPDPWLDAQVLLAEATGLDRASLLANPDLPVDEGAIRRFNSFLARRCVREPVAYIVGRKEFWGRQFHVDRSVLVPRPETELLIERALALGRDREVFADIGTGSGCVGLTVALERPHWRVYAADLSRDALAVAAENREALGAANAVLLRGDLLAPVPERPTIIAANLPYVPSGEMDSLAPEVRKWEPRRALDGGPDGLRFVSRLLAQVSHLRGFDGWVVLEIDPRQAAAVEEIVRERFPGARITLCQDLAGRNRVVEIRVQFTTS